MKVVAFALAVLALGAGAPPGGKTFRANGIAVRYPEGWFASARALTPVTSPEQILAVASYPLPLSDSGADGCEPAAALARMPATGAFIFGWEYGSVSTVGIRARDFPRRPRHFTLPIATTTECMGLSSMIRFRDAGRAFQIQVAFGKRAGLATRAAVLRILDSFSAQ
ncbi:MAG TPA: hypothetical protein VGM80_06445 [Gaiellaceae bacterium]|jgi:hypothetical protein